MLCVICLLYTKGSWIYWLFFAQRLFDLAWWPLLPSCMSFLAPLWPFLRGTAGLLTVFKTRPHWGFTLHSSDSGLVWFFLSLGMELLFPQHCCPRTPFLDSHKWLRAQHCIFKVRILLFIFFLWCHHFMMLKFICHSYLQLNFILWSMSEFLYVKGRERRRAVQQCSPSQCLQMSLAIAWWSCIHRSLINPFHCLTSNTDKCTTFKARFFYFIFFKENNSPMTVWDLGARNKQLKAIDAIPALCLWAKQIIQSTSFSSALKMCAQGKKKITIEDHFEIEVQFY